MRGNLSKSLSSASVLAQRLASVIALSSVERAFLAGFRQRSETYAPGSEISPAHPMRIRPRLIVSGWAARQRMLSNGRCQLLSVLLPGDIIGSCEERRPIDNETVIAVNNVHVMDMSTILRIVESSKDDYRNILHGITLLDQAEESRIIDSLVRMGCQTAIERTANILIELYDRCKTIGFVNDGSFMMPLTQEMLANSLGLSVVHVNRIIRQLKEMEIISVNSGEIKILNRSMLESHADDAWIKLYMLNKTYKSVSQACA